MIAGLQETLGALAALPGVRAALAATEADGLPAAAIASGDIDAEALAAFATALCRRTRLANLAAGYGDTHHLTVDAREGRLFVAMNGEVALVVLADRDTMAGLVRVELQRALRRVA